MRRRRSSPKPKYKVKCVACGRRFTVVKSSSRVPKHAPKGRPTKPYTTYVPCPGSGHPGTPTEVVIPM